MKTFKVKAVLLDIEGTTTSISFVKDILFPYAKEKTAAYLQETLNYRSTQEIVQDLVDLTEYVHFKREYGYGNTSEVSIQHISAFVNYLIDKDLKVAPLKILQGLVWQKGYEDGTLKGHVYQDVPVAFQRWTDAGIRIAIYSSGSVKAQKLLFAKSDFGNLLPFISAHFDTAVGHKQEKDSYVNIAAELSLRCEDILFLTDIVKEAEAASLAGMQTAILNRSGNSPLTDDQKLAFIIVNDFNDLEITLQ